jgi:hypothetical protein
MGTTYNPQTILSGFRSTDIVSDELVRIQADLAAKVDRNGVAPNQMEADFDMNSNRILNLHEGVLGSDGVNLSQVQNIVNSAVAAVGGSLDLSNSAPLTFNFGVAVGSQGTVSRTTFNLTTLFGVTSFTGLTVIVNGVVQVPGLAYTVTTPTTVVFSESLNTDTDIMFIYGDLSPTPVLPNILASNIGYDFGVYYDGATTASDTMFSFVALRSFTLAANFSGSYAKAATAAAASTTFDVQKNGVSIGTFNFAAAASTATFTAGSITSFAAGDVLKVVCPATPDVLLSDISLSLAGTVA